MSRAFSYFVFVYYNIRTCEQNVIALMIYSNDTFAKHCGGPEKR